MMGPRSGLSHAWKYTHYTLLRKVFAAHCRGARRCCFAAAMAGAPHLLRKHIKWRILCLQVNQY